MRWHFRFLLVVPFLASVAFSQATLDDILAVNQGIELSVGYIATDAANASAALQTIEGRQAAMQTADSVRNGYLESIDDSITYFGTSLEDLVGAIDTETDLLDERLAAINGNAAQIRAWIGEERSVDPSDYDDSVTESVVENESYYQGVEEDLDGEVLSAESGLAEAGSYSNDFVSAIDDMALNEVNSEELNALIQPVKAVFELPMFEFGEPVPALLCTIDPDDIAGFKVLPEYVYWDATDPEYAEAYAVVRAGMGVLWIAIGSVAAAFKITRVVS